MYSPPSPTVSAKTAGFISRSEPSALQSVIGLKVGDVIRPEHLGRSAVVCLADNPIHGPFRESNDLVGRVASEDIPAGTVITGAVLVALSRSQLEHRLRNFWRRCK
ncbi:hypothetical protein KF707_00385 [Candidatus Obscuribacterales bacterium]|nr:hypothetical protein [Candidatus Obscuribacterales bacterium]MBX3149957.1 hypothetical protein [Candidatus Obscuribacterales bacterium]